MTDWTPDAMRTRHVRYTDLKPCLNAFVDARTPGSDAKENFTIIGPGVSENPNQHVHLPEPHGFNIGGARQPAGCLNSQHSHETAEVFIVHSGRWRFMWGPKAEDGSVILEKGDVISLPIHMFRGFENITDDEAEASFLFAVLGGDDPGKVTWTPGVFDLAKDYGLVLLKGGRLVDTTQGETVPEGATRETPPDAATLERLASPSDADMLKGVVRASDMAGNPASPLAGEGVEEAPIITPAATGDGFAPGPITGWWPHGFNLRRLTVRPGAATPLHAREEEEVILMQSGSLDLTWRHGDHEHGLTLGPGDAFSTPKGLPHAFSASGSEPAIAYVVRGGDAPAMPAMEVRAAA